MKIIRKISSVMNTVLGYVTFVAFFAIMVFIILNVFMRYVLDSPILGAYEIVEQMMFVGVFSSFAYAQQQGSHIRVSMLLLHLPRPIAMALCGVTSLLGASILGVLSYAAYKQLLIVIANNYTSAMLKFSLTPFYILEVVCSVVFGIAVLVDAIDYFTAIANKERAQELAAKF